MHFLSNFSFGVFSRTFFHVFFFSLAFRDFLWWFFSWIFSLAMIWYTFLIAHNCNYLRLCYCSFICEAHAHESTTQVSPPLQFSFSSLKASLFTYISAASSLKFPWSIFLGNMSSWARYATATVCLCQPACLCLSVYLSRCLLKIETWGMCCGARAWRCQQRSRTSKSLLPFESKPSEKENVDGATVFSLWT